MFSTNLKKKCCSFVENMFKKYKMAAKMADILSNDCSHSNSSILEIGFLHAMKSARL